MTTPTATETNAGVEQRLSAVEQRLGGIEACLTAVEATLTAFIEEQREWRRETNACFERPESRVDRVGASVNRMYLTMTGILGGIIVAGAGAIIAVLLM